MPLKWSLADKIEIVVIIEDNYKIYREAAINFNRYMDR